MNGKCKFEIYCPDETTLDEILFQLKYIVKYLGWELEFLSKEAYQHQHYVVKKE